MSGNAVGIIMSKIKSDSIETVRLLEQFRGGDPKALDRLLTHYRSDLDAAGIPFRDGAGRVADFHALRHTFISNLASGGIHPKTAQALARHSTITLTMDRYTHTLRGEQADALAVLPDLSQPARQAVRATGTEDAQPAGKNLACYFALSGRSGEVSGGAGGQSLPATVGSASARQSPQSRGETAEKTENGSVWESNPLRALFKPSTGFEDPIIPTAE
jgi:hypothetical protein